MITSIQMGLKTWQCLLCWQITMTTGWLVTDWAGSGHVEPMVDTEEDFFYITPDMTVSLNNDIYWTAPEEYIGNKVTVCVFVLA